MSVSVCVSVCESHPVLSPHNFSAVTDLNI